MSAAVHLPTPLPAPTGDPVPALVPDAHLLGNADADYGFWARPTRLTYYNPRLDARYARGGNVRRPDRESSHPDDDGTVRGGPLLAPTEEHPANLVSSLCSDGMHRPALDIDVPLVVVPSSTPGHHHLYFPTVALDDTRWALLLVTLELCGILSPSHVAAVRDRGQTLLRPPHVTAPRTPPTPDPTPDEDFF